MEERREREEEGEGGRGTVREEPSELTTEEERTGMNRGRGEEREQEAISLCSLTVLSDIFGPHDNWHLEDSHVIPGLIHKM